MDENNADARRKFPETWAGAEVSDIDLDKEEIYVDGERLTEKRAEQITAEVLAKVRHHFGDVDLDEEVVIVNGERFTEADALAVTEELGRREREDT